VKVDLVITVLERCDCIGPCCYRTKSLMTFYMVMDTSQSKLTVLRVQRLDVSTWTVT